MAKQYQNPCTSASFQKATFSFWFRVPTSTAATTAASAIGGGTGTGVDQIAPFNWMGGIELLAFGPAYNPDDPDNAYYSSINVGMGDRLMSRSITTDGSHHFSIGNNDSTSWTVAAWFGPDPLSGRCDPTFSDWIYSSDYDNMGTALAVEQSHRHLGHQAYMGKSFTYDNWHHVLVSADLTSGDTYSTFTETVSGRPSEVVQSITRGRIIEIYFDKVRVHGLYRSFADLNGFYTNNPPFQDPSAVPSSDPCDITLNGAPFSLPSFTQAYLGGPSQNLGTVTFNPEIKYAEFQCWIGQYINPAANIGKFVDSNGKPVDAATAEAAFGKPTFRFRRDKKKKRQFTTNDGTGGSVSNTSGIADFSTGPSL